MYYANKTAAQAHARSAAATSSACARSTPDRRLRPSAGGLRWWHTEERDRLTAALDAARAEAARSCCSAARPASARRRLAAEAAPAPDALVLRGAASRAAPRPVRADRRGAARLPARRPGGARRLRPAARPPRAAAARARRARRRERPRDAVRGAPLRVRARRRRAVRASSSSTTCSGPTRRRSSCWPRSPSRCAELPRAGDRRLPLRRPAARPRRAPAAQRAAPRRPARGARAASRSSRGETAELLAALLGERALARARPRGPRPHAGHPVLRRGARGGAARRAARCSTAARGLELAGDGEVPLPDTVRDAVLISASELSRRRRARPPRSPAVAGERVRPRPRRRRSSSDAGRRRAARARACCARTRDGRAAFRHALTREALYADVPWLRRRALHRALAEALEAAGRAEPRGRRPLARRARRATRARDALLRAAAESEAVHAYRDAADGRPPGARAVARGATRTPRASRRSSATRAAPSSPASWPRRRARGASWRRPRRASATALGVADAQRRLAAVYELRGDRDAAFAARRARGRGLRRDTAAPAEAAVERLAMANQLRVSAAATARRSAGRGRARRTPTPRGRLDLRRARARARGHGARQAAATTSAGLETVRGGLALALEHDLTPVAAELYQRLSVVALRRRPTTAAPRRRSTPRSSSAATSARRGHGGRLRHLPRLRAARARRVAAGGRDRPRADRGRHRGLGRRGAARRDPRLPGQARLGAPAAHLLAARSRSRSATTT